MKKRFFHFSRVIMLREESIRKTEFEGILWHSLTFSEIRATFGYNRPKTHKPTNPHIRTHKNPPKPLT